MNRFIKILKKIINVLPYIFFAITLILIVQIVIALSNKTTPSVLGYSVFSVESPSMEPAFMTGDLVFVKIVDESEIAEGDVITFRRSDKPALIITHRVISITEVNGERYFTTLGDNNHGLINDWEKDFSGELIIGKVTGKSPFLGKIYNGIVAGGISIVYGGAIFVFLIIAIAEILNITKEIKLAKNKDLLEAKSKLVEEELQRLKKEQEQEQNNSNQQE